jgi:hypothetical protein
VKLNQLDASQGPMMPLVKEFSDVFFVELLGMPLDSDIECVIEIVPMLLLCIGDPIIWLAKQLAELKDHIMKLLETGYIRPSSPQEELL